MVCSSIPLPPDVGPNTTNTTYDSGEYVDDNVTYVFDLGIYWSVEQVINTKIILAICIFGIIGNILNLLILSRKSLTTHMERLEKSAHFGLIALALSDLLFCISALPHTVKDPSRFDTPTVDFWLLYDAYGDAVVNTFILSSTWLTVAMAISRYIAICYPLHAREHLSLTSSRVVIAMVFLFR